jgi:hypothetical protein
MIKKEKLSLIFETSDLILKLVDEALSGKLDMPRGDLQGVCEAMASKIVNETIKFTRRKGWCYHYEYLPYKEEDLLEECKYCKANKELKNKRQKGETF